MADRDELITQIRSAIAEMRLALEKDDFTALEEVLDQLEQTLPSEEAESEEPEPEPEAPPAPEQPGN